MRRIRPRTQRAEARLDAVDGVEPEVTDPMADALGAKVAVLDVNTDSATAIAKEIGGVAIACTAGPSGSTPPVASKYARTTCATC